MDEIFLAYSLDYARTIIAVTFPHAMLSGANSWGDMVIPSGDSLMLPPALHVWVVDDLHRFRVLCHLRDVTAGAYSAAQAFQRIYEPRRVIAIRGKDGMALKTCETITSSCLPSPTICFLWKRTHFLDIVRIGHSYVATFQVSYDIPYVNLGSLNISCDMRSSSILRMESRSTSFRNARISILMIRNQELLLL